ncbi:hypothetical protein [Corynebacterium variabile]|uniref:hypothetical protein n=1 Tax=Corynebacterium variabile TaxID=1727 RepID=UPI0028AC5902|nr:hypothetical protein [Corynebacterium variabile]
MPQSESARTPEKLDGAVADLHAQGKGRNATARELNVSTRQVDHAARRLGITFDAEHVRTAVAVNVASAGEQRRVLAGRFRSIAEVALNHADEHSDDAAELFGWIKAAGTAVDKDLAIQTQLDRVDDHSSMTDTMAQFAEFGAMVRAAAEQAGKEPP